jgi:phosphonate transport system ATP-binding protein
MGRVGFLPVWKTLVGLFPEIEVRRADALLERVGIGGLGDARAGDLSGGQQQRVAIARALMQEPELFLADEPVASLDPATSDSVMRHLANLNRDGITVLCSLHFLSLARKYGSRVVALRDGRVVFDGLPGEIDDELFRDIYGEDAEEVEIR